MHSLIPIYPSFNLILYLVLSAFYVYPVFIGQKIKYSPISYRSGSFWSFTILVILFCVFAFSSGDYIHYYKLIENIIALGIGIHLEDAYVWILMNVSKNYWAWRLIVWGSATIILLIAFKRLKLRALTSYASIIIFYLITLYCMRGNLGTSIMLLGLTYLMPGINKNKWSSLFVGSLLLISSFYFHKSMLLSLVLLIPSIFNLTRRTLRISFYVFPFAVTAIRIALHYISENGLEGLSQQTSDSATLYANVDTFEYTANGILNLIVQYFAPYLVLVYAYTNNLMNRLPRYIRFFFNYWYVWLYLATVCAFQETGGWFYSRFMYMSNLPLAVFMAYVLAYFPRSKMQKWIIFMGLLGCLYNLAYACYKL